MLVGSVQANIAADAAMRMAATNHFGLTIWSVTGGILAAVHTMNAVDEVNVVHKVHEPNELRQTRLYAEGSACLGSAESGGVRLGEGGPSCCSVAEASAGRAFPCDASSTPVPESPP